MNNWAVGLDAKGQPKRNRYKHATIAGSLVNGDVTNYPPPTYGLWSMNFKLDYRVAKK